MRLKLYEKKSRRFTMNRQITDPEFLSFCETAKPIEVVEKITNQNIRGLENIALRSISTRNKLPANVVNLLVAYFYSHYGNQVYNRNDLARLYDYWASKDVRTMANAAEMVQEDIEEVLKSLK
jgi:replication initiation and membrane attachment protein DnaB